MRWAKAVLIPALVSVIAAPAIADEWQGEWGRTVAAAEQEGVVVIESQPNLAWQNFIAREFPKAFPKIKIDLSVLQTADFLARIRIERGAGRYLWDIGATGPTSGYPLYKDGALDPFLPEMILPEVKDEAAWHGWKEAFLDLPHKYIFSMSAFIVAPFYNAAFVPPDKVAQDGMRILLDPAYKGKIAWHDPAIVGAGQVYSLLMRTSLGDDGLKKLVTDQRVLFNRNQQNVVEAMARGIAWFTIGPPVRSLIQPYQLAGATVKTDLRLIGNTPETSHISVGGNTLFVFNRRPHPNAARVFVNWVLQKDIQYALAKELDQGSRRNDIPSTVPTGEERIKDAKYLTPQSEEEQPAYDAAVSFIAESRKSAR